MNDGLYPTQNSSYIVIENNKFHGTERDSLATITDPDKKMSNGYFHGVDKVIYNPQLSINQIITSSNTTVIPAVNPQYLKFKELVSAAGISAKDFVNITAIDVIKKFTLFVPSNDAIIAEQIAGNLPKTGAQGSQTLSTAEKLRLATYIKYFFVPEQEIFTDGKKTGSFPTSKPDPASSQANPLFLPVVITYSGNSLTVTDNTGKAANVDVSQPNTFPQNMIARDGVIHIIDDAFSSQY